MSHPPQTTYYIPIQDPNAILEGCETLLRSVLQRIIEKHINGFAAYTNESNVVRVEITKIEIEFRRP